MGGRFSLIGRISSFAPKSIRRRIRLASKRLSDDIDYYDEVEILSKSCATPCLFLLEDADIHISRFGWGVSIFSTNRQDGERLHRANELTKAMDRPTCESLRNFFVGFETMVRCGALILRIIDEKRASSTETLSRETVKRFCASAKAEKFVDIIHSLLDARNQFCHLMENCERIEYRGMRLELCFNRSSFLHNRDRYGVSGKQEKQIGIFCEDAVCASDALIKYYRSIQHEQIDFNRLDHEISMFLTQ